MNRTKAFYLTLVLSVLASHKAAAQQAAGYDPVAQKRADLRISCKQAQADPVSTWIANSADRNRLLDFTNLLPKRADLRLRASTVGLYRAYDEWMAREHAH